MLQSLPESAAASGYLRCSSGGVAYGVPLSRVRSVDRPERMEWNSQATGPEGWLPGAQGRVPVFGISNLLEADRGKSSFGALIQLRGTDGQWALGFERVERFDTQVDDRQIRELPALIRSEVRSSLRGVVSAGEDVVLCLDVDRLAPGRPQHAVTVTPEATGRPSGWNASASLKPTDSRAQVLRFWLQGVTDSFGLSARQVIEFVTQTPFSFIPRASASAPAVAIWRDRAVPVVDLGRAMSLTQLPCVVERLLIVQVSAQTGLIAIPTGGTMARLQNATEFRSSPNQSGFKPELVRGIFEDSNGRMTIPDLDAILTARS